MTNWEGVPESIDKYAGFVYLITNTVTDQKYIGRKYFWRDLRVKKKGKSRRVRKIKESEWKEYKSSSQDVLADIAKYGEDKFRFQILSVWETRARVNEQEIAEQFARDVLHKKMPNGEYEYYNKSILSKFYRPKEEGTPEYAAKCANISKSLKEGYSSGKLAHGLKGKLPTESANES